MPTANVRYGRPKGTGLDDRRHLETIAALLAANPKLKPTSAIRSLGIENPSTIRRLRDKFRMDQSRLMANASRVSRANGSSLAGLNVGRRTPAHAPPLPAPIAPQANTIGLERAATARPAIDPEQLLSSLCDLSFAALSAAVEAQAAVTQAWLALPAVSMAARSQLTVGSVAVAAYARCKGRHRHLN
jgi:hypothetical protein